MNKLNWILPLTFLILLISACTNANTIFSTSSLAGTINATSKGTTTHIPLATKTPSLNPSPVPSITSNVRLDNKVLALSNSSGLKLIDLSNQSTILELDLKQFDLYWAPNGRYVAYYDFRNGISGVYITDIWTQKEILIRNNDNAEGLWESNFSNGNRISWSPDSSKLAFQGVSEAAEDIFVYNLVNRNLLNLTNYPTHDYGVDFSPDGESIIFISYREELINIFSVPTEGGEVTKLTNFSEVVLLNFPSWSPDGQKIAFYVVPGSPAILGTQSITKELYVINSDGSNLSQLIRSDKFCILCYGILWTTNSESIIFTLLRDSYEVFSISLETKEIKQLSNENNTIKSPLSWFSKDYLFYLESDQVYRKNRLCITDIHKWACKEILEISEEGPIFQYNIFDLSD